MSRLVPASIVAALQQDTVRPFLAVEFLFDTEALRMWTGQGNRVIDGAVYTGAGDLLTVTGLEEAADLTARAATLTLAGVAPEIISLALQEPFQGRSCRILFGVRDVDEFVEIFAGFVNTMDIQHDQNVCSIAVTVDSKLVRLNSARNRRYTHESQQARYPGDTFFSFVTDLQDRQVPWGRKA